RYQYVFVGAWQQRVNRFTFGLGGIETFILQMGLLVFEGAGGFHLLFDAQEQGHGVGWHLVTQETADVLEIQLLYGHRRGDGGHAGATVGIGDFDTVGHCFGNLRVVGYQVFHFGGGDVLALPAIGVTEAVDELGVAEADVAQHVTGVEPAVAFLEHVGEDDLFGLFRIGVAVQRCLVADLGNQQALAAFLDFLHEAIGAAYGLFLVLVILHQNPLHRREADGVVEVEDVGETDVAVGGGIQFDDFVDLEAILERHPDVGAQTVADHLANGIVAVVGLLGLIQQVAAQFAHVADGGG